MRQEGGNVNAREPSFTAMWHAWLRNHHATRHLSPIFSDTLSVQLVPDQALDRIVAVQNSFSSETAHDAGIYPARYPLVSGVAATDFNDRLANFSKVPMSRYQLAEH
jgi:hypothetical protein